MCRLTCIRVTFILAHIYNSDAAAGEIPFEGIPASFRYVLPRTLLNVFLREIVNNVEYAP